MITPGFGAWGKTVMRHPTLPGKLRSHWELEESSGQRDDAFASNNLTDNNTVGQADGIMRKCASFASANSEYLSNANGAGQLSTGDVDFTFYTWVYLATKASNMAVLAIHGVGTEEYLLAYNQPSDRFTLLLRGGGGTVTANSFGSPSVATWYNLVGGYDATANNVFIQVNNGTVDTAGYVHDGTTGTSEFRIGARNDGVSYWNGRVDEVSFYDAVLTAAEKTFLYNNGNGRSFR